MTAPPDQPAPTLTPSQLQRKKDAKKWMDALGRKLFSLPGMKFKPRPKK